MGILNNELKPPRIESNLNPPNRRELGNPLSSESISKRHIENRHISQNTTIGKRDPYHNFRRKLRKDIF